MPCVKIGELKTETGWLPFGQKATEPQNKNARVFVGVPLFHLALGWGGCYCDTGCCECTFVWAVKPTTPMWKPPVCGLFVLEAHLHTKQGDLKVCELPFIPP